MPKISSKHIAEAIYESTEGKSGRELTLALKRGAQLLSKKRLLGKSEDILKALQDIIDKKNGTLRMKFFSANKFTAEKKKKLEEEAKEKYKAQKVISEFLEMPELLGGMRIEVGDEILDNTYKNKLLRLEKFLIRNN